MGPYVLAIGTGVGYQDIPSLNPGDRVEFDFAASGSTVYYSVRDPYANVVLTGNAGDDTYSGQGAFIAATSGIYRIRFSSTGFITPSVLTINYTVYPVE